MNISEVFIKRPIMTVLIMVCITLGGIAGYKSLPVSDLPVVDYPVIVITVSYPGASPDTMANAVASPIENECTQIPGLTNMISNNTEGQTQIILTFDLDRNVDLAAPDVQAAISRAMGNLPTDLPSPPTYEKTNPSDTPIIYIAVSSDTLTSGNLYDFANKRIGQRMSMIEGVSQIQVWGAKSAVRVQVDPNKLAAYKIGINDIAQSLNNGTVLIPAGSLNGKVRTFSIEPKGQLFFAKDYDELIVAYRNNAPVRLKDIAKTVDSMQNDVVNVAFGRTGEPLQMGCTVIAVSRQAGTNTVALSAHIKDTLEQLKREIPGSVKLDIIYDKSDQIVESINDVKTTIIISIILVVVVIFMFLGRVSDTIIPSIAIPVSLIATFGCMLAAGFSLDNLSLMAIILAIGFVVDDAIVVLENNVRLIELGQKPILAAVNGAKEIGFTIVSMTLSLAIIFIPLLFMAGVVGRIFREFSITVVMTIIASGILSLTLTPMMCARILKETSKKTKLEEGIKKFINKIINGYGVILKWVLKRPIITVIIWAVCLAGTVFFFKLLPQTFLPEGDSGSIQGQLMVPLSTSTEQVRIFQDQLNEIFHNHPAVEKSITVTGLQPGADQSTGPIFLNLKPLKERKSIQQIVNELRVQCAKLPLGFAYLMAMPSLKLSTGGESTASGSKYSYLLTGAAKDDVYNSGMELADKMKTLPGFTDIQNSVRLDLPQLNIELFRDRASTLGITARDIEYTLALSYSGGKITTYKTDIDQYWVITELDKKYQRDPVDLYSIYLRPNSKEDMVPLGSVCQWTEGVGPQNVPHINQLNAATVSFNLKQGVPLGTATKALEETASKIAPSEITGRFQGEAEQFKDAMASMGILILIAIFLEYVLLGILYESYVHPFTVLTTLPVAAMGGLATLFIFRSELSLYAFVGLFMLLGIVTKNGIMMVDFANANLEKGNTTDFDAIYNACLVRFRPILMTGLAAIMGTMPIALGYGADGASRRPLGLIVVGGLVFSQIITLFVTPGLFLYMQKFQSKVLNKFELTMAGSARKGEET